ncbi:preprotein translocase subunit YajC [Paludibacter jiangxiensis]|uniref:Sec translocon accessory complex subunit YajC n=1 Tax=Paludibacter jiangxiensis TaxID=681398 RepID=A0A171A523_9BACT|nr:preprotein translocase subunit YajC [Paludibacter jiangxiensis]GAT63293.1 preprotein translocase subunit YajC [Paludibacter jiangxiensis]
MNTLALILQTQGGQPGGMANYSGIIMIVLLFVVFYFFMIRPQSKRQKEIRNFRAAMKVGDKVITSGGIYGRIKEISDDTILLEVDENVRIRVDKNSVFATAADTQQK